MTPETQRKINGEVLIKSGPVIVNPSDFTPYMPVDISLAFQMMMLDEKISHEELVKEIIESMMTRIREALLQYKWNSKNDQ